MLVARQSTRSMSRRAAFTLVEVLVVVAIVVILASVGTLATFKFLEDAKVDAARAKANNLSTVYDSYMVKNPDMSIEMFQDISVLEPFLNDGIKGLLDPWGNTYQFMPVSDATTGRPRMFFYTTAVVDGRQRMIGSPKDLEGQVNGQ
jgi:general secretion pathway protein G